MGGIISDPPERWIASRGISMDKREENLVLIADDDKMLCALVSKALQKKGFRAIQAHDGQEALDLFHSIRPHVVIVDVRMPVMSGLEFLDAARKNGGTTPVIVTTGFPDIETAVGSIQGGAFDYIVKPFQMEVLEQKIDQALKASRLRHENAVLTELASLHEITRRLSNTHDLGELLHETLECCLELAEADSGSIQLADKQSGKLVLAQQKGLAANNPQAVPGSTDAGAISRRVFESGTSILVADGAIYPKLEVPLERSDIHSAISVPLRVMDETIGVVNLNRQNGKAPFTMVHLNTIDVLAAQAGVAINNANLYTSIHQKLSELSLISNYSEQLMGLIDKEDIIQSLFDTVGKNFGIDFIGYFEAVKRNFEFEYWTRGPLSEADREDLLKLITEEYSKISKAKVQRRRVYVRRSRIESSGGFPVSLPLAFTHTARLVLEDVDFGMLFFGSTENLSHESEKVSLLGSLINQTRIALTNSRLYSDMKENYIRTIKALAIAVDAKDTYTHGHSENVMVIAEEMAKEMGLDPRVIGVIRDGALLHDIGKIGIPGHILNKPGALTYEEFNGIMKTHVTLGANIVKDVPFLRDLYELILYHHENWDGSGYPRGIRGDGIPIGARILHVADAFEAMTSNRPYRNSLGELEAFKRLREERGRQFDPTVVDAFFKVAKKKGWLRSENA